VGGCAPLPVLFLPVLLKGDQGADSEGGPGHHDQRDAARDEPRGELVLLTRLPHTPGERVGKVHTFPALSLGLVLVAHLYIPNE
jgi:hypothetical protein